MLVASMPAKIPTVWAASAGPGFIRTVPIASQIGIVNGAASYTDGFPPLTFTPQASGGVPPFGQDTNGVLNIVTSWLRWTQAGAPVFYDATFAGVAPNGVGGYPAGGKLAQSANAARAWMALTDNLSTNPDSGGLGWLDLPLPVTASGIAPGSAPLQSVFAAPTDNLVLSNDGTNPTRDVDVSPGSCRDLANATNLFLAGTMVKRIDQSWAAGGAPGAPVGGLDAGSLTASSTYHVYLIGKLNLIPTLRSRTSNVATLTITGHGLGAGGTAAVRGVGDGYDGIVTITSTTANTISYSNTGSNESSGTNAFNPNARVDGFDVILSRQALNAYPSPAMPGGFTAKACLGSVLTDGSSNIRAFLQSGADFWLSAPVLDINAATATAPTLFTMTVPTGLRVTWHGLGLVRGNFTSTSHNPLVWLTCPDLAAVSSGPASIGVLYSIAGATGMNADTNSEVNVLSNASAQIRTNANDVQNYSFSTRGWTDPRRRLY